MSTATIVTELIHFFVAALWTGSVLFFGFFVLPTSGPNLSGALLDRFAMLSRGSAVLLLLTGGHMAAASYTQSSLLTSGRGHVVLGMLVLWLVLMGLLEVGNARVEDGTVGASATRVFQAAGFVAVLLLVDAGLLLTGAV
jgi:uncharacterized membrane protein